MRFLGILAAVVMTALLFACQQQDVDLDDMQIRGDRLYLGNAIKPYTGKAYDWYPNGQMKSERTFKDGQLHGLNVDWHKNGQKREEGNFKNGVRDGLWVEWDSSGKKTREILWKENSVISRRRY